MTAEPASYSLFRHRPVFLLWLARVAASIAYQMQVVAVGWQIYVMTSSPMQLGLVGLMQFIPQFALVLIAGHVVDQHDRKRVMLSAQTVEACAVAILSAATALGLASSALILAAVFALGAARSFEATTLQTIPPAIVPPAVLPRVIAQLSSATQTATIVGPAVGGALLILGTSYVYAICALLFLGSTILVWCIPLERPTAKRTPLSFDTLFAGVNFVRRNPVVLGAMSLDMFAVIFAGATALLPIFVRDILAVGSWGLGLMRAAPAVGALTCSFIIARWPLTRHVGNRDVCGGRYVWIGDHSVRAVELVHLFDGHADGDRRVRHAQRRDQAAGDPTRDAGRDARTRERGQLAVHRHVQSDRRVSRRRDRRSVRHHPVGFDRRHRHVGGGAGLS